MPESIQTIDACRRWGLDPDRLPRHVAIIMDGNGRWAKRRGWRRAAGHQQGAKVVPIITTLCARLGLDYLTLYSFSVENWRRPQEEIDALMALLVEYLLEQRPVMMSNNVRLRHVGRREGLSPHVLDVLDDTMRATAGNTGLNLCLALNYGSRLEIADAVRAIAREVQAGRLDPDAIDEAAISNHLYTAGIPDPDLLIRTAGQLRISNFLLWQISYAELLYTDVLWPDFTEQVLVDALKEFATRERRFGGLGPQQGS